MEINIERFSSLSNCNYEIGKLLETASQKKVERKLDFNLVLSGGRTPVALYKYLSESEFSRSIPWRDISFFWGDERCVPHDHPDSNYFIAERYLFQNLPVDRSKIFRMPGDFQPVSKAAAQYEELLNKHLLTKNIYDTENKKHYGKYPAFDFIMLGMGFDGHTASLFPHHHALSSEKLVVGVESEYAVPLVPRLSLTLPVINNSDTVLFVINGVEKIRLYESFSKEQHVFEKKYPAAMIQPRRNLIWYLVDEG